MRTQITAVALGTLMLASGPAAFEPAPAELLPCESAPPPTDPDPPIAPVAPSNLRIIGGDALSLWEDSILGVDGSQSGPYVNESTEAGVAVGSPAAEGPHAYFELLASRPDCAAAYSLRSTAQIEQYIKKVSGSASNVLYLYPNDPDPRRQDAAKVIIPTTKNSLQTQVRVPIPPHAPNSLLVTWDSWWGREFKYQNHGIPTYKAWQLASPASQIWTEPQVRFDRGASTGNIGEISVRYYGGSGAYGANVTDNLPLSPMVASFLIAPETWTRQWIFLKPATDGYYEFSHWAADETRGPVLIHDRLLLKPGCTAGGNCSPHWESFWVEFNTSHSTIANRGQLVAYVRNIVVLQKLSGVSELLVRPTR